MPSFDATTELGRLYSLEVDAAHAYRNAVALAGGGPVQAELRLFALEHQRHVLVLLETLVRLGRGAPDSELDVKGPRSSRSRSDADERRHAWIERALDQRLWEADESAHPRPDAAAPDLRRPSRRRRSADLPAPPSLRGGDAPIGPATGWAAEVGRRPAVAGPRRGSAPHPP